ncbi:response regulator [Cytophagaceae bacterium DM2B3-1]|uniref:Response regulator n=1 Tax=Xanthocytophaga flava TaxID=3048013 RepID=A0ABT7CPM8_9BACT|nr:response regulator [Xanthocytophaga flavus]MDJ1494945.1 response regulator [Xanthocytophaga flavus]
MKQNTFFLLIAEDDPDDRDMLRMVLKENFPHWQYYVANNGQLLLDYLTNRPLDLPPVSLIMLDINMPIKDGVETLIALRRCHAYTQLPIVAYSTSKTIQGVHTFMQAGGTAYFQKPCDLEEMIDIFSGLSELVLVSQSR